MLELGAVQTSVLALVGLISDFEALSILYSRARDSSNSYISCEGWDSRVWQVSSFCF